jgi:hypothetical protein
MLDKKQVEEIIHALSTLPADKVAGAKDFILFFARATARQDYMRPISEMVDELPPERQAEVRDFVEFLLAKHPPRPRRKPRFGWAGALKDLRGEFTSVDLQHEIARLRSEVE